MSGGLADDMHFVAVWGNADVAGPAVGLGNGVGIGGGFDEASEVGGTVGGEFGQPQTAWRVSVPEFDGAERSASCRRGCGPAHRQGDRSWSGREGWPRRSRPDLDSGLRTGSTMAVRSLCASSQALRYEPIPSCFWSCSAEIPLEWVADQVDGRRTRRLRGSLLPCRIVPAVTEVLPAAAGTLEGVGLAAQCPSLVVTALGTAEAAGPAHFDQPGGAGVIVREHVLECEEAVGDLFHLAAPGRGTNDEHSSRSTPRPQSQHVVADPHDRSHVHKRFP